jgi:hypothetical protein
MINFNKITETIDNPKMLEIYLDEAWQNAFCYALVIEPGQSYSKMLMTIIAGSDSTLQTMKAAVDLGSYGISYGYGKKQLTDYHFNKEFNIYTDKGKYENYLYYLWKLKSSQTVDIKGFVAIFYFVYFLCRYN